MNDRVTLSIANHIAEVQLSRPDKFNALDPDMFEAITAVGEELRSRKDVRAVVLSGEGKHFCSGLDVASFGTIADGNEGFAKVSMEKVYGSDSNKFQRIATVWHDIEAPVIAVLQGACYGGGIQLALGADLRYADATTKMSVMEIKWGLIPDVGISQPLRKLVRMDIAKELLFTGRIVEAEEALELGLITRLCGNPMEEAHKMAELIALKSPDAIKRDKKLLEASWDMSRSEGLELEAVLQSEIIFLDNQMEAVAANFEKRAPEFK